MTRAGIEQLLYLMDEAFENNPMHSLMKNMESVRDDDWAWLSPDAVMLSPSRPNVGVRTIQDAVEHVGANKYIYDSAAFGDQSITWEKPYMPQTSAPADMIAWLREGHAKLRASVAALEDDEELTKNRMGPWGTEANTRWLINMMIQHDLYHAGEINHIRALHQKDDA